MSCGQVRHKITCLGLKHKHMCKSDINNRIRYDCITWMEPFWAISWFFISSLHRPFSVRSFSRWGFTIYRRCRNDTEQLLPLWHRTLEAESSRWIQCWPETLQRAPCGCRCCWCTAQWTHCCPGFGQWKLWAWGPRADCSLRRAWGGGCKSGMSYDFNIWHEKHQEQWGHPGRLT